MRIISIIFIMMIYASQAQADPVTIVLSLVSTFTASVTGTLIAGSLLIHFAVVAGLAFVSKLLAPSQAAAQDRGYEAQNSRGGALPHAIIYGETVVGGVIIYEEVTDNEGKFHRVIAMAGHECDSFITIYFNNEELTIDGSGEITAPDEWAGNARIKLHLGDETVADTDLVAESAGLWTVNHIGNEICYIYVRFENKRAVFPSGFPIVTAKIRGAKVFDPRTDTTVWSDNSALCARDFFTADYGLRAVSTKMVDYTDAANVCDETVTLSAGGTEARYTTNGSFTTQSTPRTTITALHSAMAGYPAFSQGKWSSVAGEYNAATTTLTAGDLRSNISVATRHPRSVNFNSIYGLFKGEETNWVTTEYPAITSTTFLAEDNSVDNPAELNLNFTITSTMAQRVAKIMLFRNREQISFTATFGMAAFKVAIGEVIQFTYTRLGWSGKEFECVGWLFQIDEKGEPTIKLTLTEISEAVFDWNAEESTFTANNTTLTNPFFVPTLGVTASIRVQILAEKISFIMTVTATSSASNFIDSVDVEYKLSSDTTFITGLRGDLGVFEISELENASYDVRARARNIFDTPGNYTTLLALTPSTSDAPDDVENFTAVVSGSSVYLQWDATSDLSLSHYIIRHALEESGASWSNATTAVAKIARPATNISLPARPGTYMIRSVSKFDALSENVTSAVVPEVDLEDFTTTDTLTEETSFSGTLTNLVVASSQLRVLTPVADETGTYDFSTFIDTASTQRVRARIDINVNRFDSSAGLFDDLSGLFDSLGGLFDDLTGTATFADTDVKSYIATTDDDPSVSPTYSSFKLFQSGDFTARAFKFRVILSTDSDDITPSISGLTARVQY